jgi:hypothetical protein
MSQPSNLSELPRERWPMLLAGAALVAGLALVAYALLTTFGGGVTTKAAAPPPAPQVAVVTPAPAAAQPAPVKQAQRAAAKAEAPAATKVIADEERFAANDRKHVRADWVSRFYRVYETAQEEFGVNWLLIASVHKQETAFSTHPTTYRGLNFARCCAGPMQFNVTNGPTTTWERYRDAWRSAARPAGYPNVRPKHPSVYDDFDAIMAGTMLLRDGGATARLDGAAWRAAYDYYGHDLTGIAYANEVLARAIGWGQKRFCINCATDPKLIEAVDAAWGAPVRAAMEPPKPKAHKKQQRREPTALAASKR